MAKLIDNVFCPSLRCSTAAWRFAVWQLGTSSVYHRVHTAWLQHTGAQIFM